MASTDFDGSPILILTLEEAVLVKGCLDFLNGLPPGLDDEGRALKAKVTRFLKEVQ